MKLGDEDVFLDDITLDKEFNDSNMQEDATRDDDLEGLMKDVGELEFSLPEEKEETLEVAQELEKNDKEDGVKGSKTSENSKKLKIGKNNEAEGELILEIGKAEKDLLEVAKQMQGKIPNNEWSEIAGKSNTGTYEVVKGDWLWKISQRIFGSGFYYAKIWALNPYITNPHEIEPGMILSFSTGSDNQLPTLNLKRLDNLVGQGGVQDSTDEYSKYGDESKPNWMNEREALMRDGVYIQYGTGDTKEDLEEIGRQNMIREYEVYEPPAIDFIVNVPEQDFDSLGFDKNARINLNFNEGFHLTTFLSSNIVQDFGKIESSYEYQGLFTNEDRFFVRFDESLDIVIGDKFSVYNSGGQISQKNSDRKGYKYSITGSFEVVQKHEENLWECKVIETTGAMSRGDRITVYTPKIESITRTYNTRLIEAVILAGFHKLKSLASLGDVVYLDRGRADGLEVGNVLEVYGFKDRNTNENISDNPTYKNGELTVITITENFATALVTQSVRDFQIGDITVTKTKEAAARATKLKESLKNGQASRVSDEVLDELDVDLNLEDLNDALLDKADKIQFTEDELAELERQEREKSILSDNEKDLQALERLETDLDAAERILKSSKLDEDRLLENESLDKLEKDFNAKEQESLDELEENFGKRYLDEDLNDKENPYGLTEFDIEEIDELLNVDLEESVQ